MPVSLKKWTKNAQEWIASKGTSKVFNKYSPYNVVRLTNGLNDNFRHQYIIVNGKLLNTYHGRRITSRGELSNIFELAANYPYLNNSKIKRAYTNGVMLSTFKNLNNYKANRGNYAGYQSSFNNFNNANGLLIALPVAPKPKVKPAAKPKPAAKKPAAKKPAAKKPAAKKAAPKKKLLMGQLAKFWKP